MQRCQLVSTCQMGGEVLHIHGVEEIHELDDVAVLEPPHDLQLAVLVALVLQHLLDDHHLASLYQLGLVHHSEAAVPNDL